MCQTHSDASCSSKLWGVNHPSKFTVPQVKRSSFLHFHVPQSRYHHQCWTEEFLKCQFISRVPGGSRDLKQSKGHHLRLLTAKQAEGGAEWVYKHGKRNLRCGWRTYSVLCCLNTLSDPLTFHFKFIQLANDVFKLVTISARKQERRLFE